jgi:hypothetical protein
MPWHVSSETFIERTESGKPNFLDWARGTYHAEVAISDGVSDVEVQDSQVIVRLVLSFDFTKERENCIHWTIDTCASQAHKIAAYPGIHSGYLSVWNASGPSTFCEVLWETPIFSPYVEIEAPYRDGDREDFNPVRLSSRPKDRSGDTLLQASHTERVDLWSRSAYVTVLQEVLKDIARLLVFGPRYADMKLAPVAKYAEYDSYIRSHTTARFPETNHFPEAAAFFSRAYCHTRSGENEELPVPERRCMTSVETIEALFDHYKIVREPPWIKASKQDWVDDLREEAILLRTVADWREFERKWATITSYTCGLNLHEGPWAGEDWRAYVWATA